MRRGQRVVVPGRFRDLVVAEMWTRDDGTRMVTAEFISGVGSVSMPEFNFTDGADA